MVLAKMDLFKYHNVYMYFSNRLLVPIPQQVVAMTVYNIFVVMCHSTLSSICYIPHEAAWPRRQSRRGEECGRVSPPARGGGTGGPPPENF